MHELKITDIRRSRSSSKPVSAFPELTETVKSWSKESEIDLAFLTVILSCCSKILWRWYMVEAQAVFCIPTHFPMPPLASKADRGHSCSPSSVAALSALAQQQQEDDPSSTCASKNNISITVTYSRAKIKPKKPAGNAHWWWIITKLSKKRT